MLGGFLKIGELLVLFLFLLIMNFYFFSFYGRVKF